MGEFYRPSPPVSHVEIEPALQVSSRTDSYRPSDHYRPDQVDPVSLSHSRAIHRSEITSTGSPAEPKMYYCTDPGCKRSRGKGFETVLARGK